jgi:hypothetical protein
LGGNFSFANRYGHSGDLEERRGVFSAAALVFFAGMAGTWGVASYGLGLRRFALRLARSRLGLNCQEPRGLFGGDFGHFVILFGFIEMAFAETGGYLAIETFLYGAVVGEAEGGEIDAGFDSLVEEVALGLEAAEFGGAFVKQAVRLGAGAVDGELEFGGGRGLHGVRGVGCVGCLRSYGLEESGFDVAAAAETPEGAVDFVDEAGFERAGGCEGGDEVGFGLGVVVFLTGADEIGLGEEAVGGGVFGAGGAAGVGARAGGELGVGDVGCELSGGRHG